jgi:peptidoglycan/LPS O-acetylase OafA/YrhL
MIEQPPPAQFSTSFSSFLDLSRWLAAFAVLINHVRNPLLFSYEDIPAQDSSLVITAWYFVSGLGFEAVIVFFVLSGFLVGGISLERARRGKFQLSDYAADRISRIYTVFVPALLLTLCLDLLGQHLFGWTGLWDRGSALMAVRYEHAFTEQHGVLTFLGNLAMLQPFFVSYLGSNIPLWTLSFEWWFYVAFAAALSFFFSRPSFRFLAAALVVLLLVGLGLRFAFFLGLWSLGVLAHRYSGTTLRWPLLSTAAFLVATAASRINATPTEPRNLQDLAILLVMAVCFAWMVISYRHLNLKILERIAPLNRLMADFSYSLYAVHFPVMLFVIGATAAILGIGQIGSGFSPADPRGFGLYLWAVFASLLVAWLFSRATEAHTKTLRGWLRTRMRKPSPD